MTNAWITVEARTTTRPRHAHSTRTTIKVQAWAETESFPVVISTGAKPRRTGLQLSF